MYKKLMSETEASKQAADISSEIDDCLQEDFLARLQCALKDFRNQYEVKMQQSRDEIVVLYRTMIQSLGDLAGSQDYTHLKVFYNCFTCVEWLSYLYVFFSFFFRSLILLD